MISEQRVLERIVRRMDADLQLIAFQRLPGGASAHVMRLDVQTADGSLQRLLLRIHSDTDRSRNARVAHCEFAALKAARAAGLPVPQAYVVDESAEVYPSPYVILDYVDGMPEFSPADLHDYLTQCAQALAKLHRALETLPEAVRQPLANLHDRAEHVLWWIRYEPTRLDETIDEGRLRAALRGLFPLAQANTPALLHGDFWPGNLIWRDGQLVGLIDWEDTELGDPLSDLSIARLELLMAFGEAAPRIFTEMYRAHMPQLDYRHLPQWDLFAALRAANNLTAWAGTWLSNNRPDVTHETMLAAHSGFVQRARHQLGL